MRKYLYDMIVRYQVYLEGYKKYQRNEFAKISSEFNKELKTLFRNIEYKSLSDLSKREINTFYRDLKKANNAFFETWTRKNLEELEKFIKLDLRFNKAILANALIFDKEQTEEYFLPTQDEKQIDKYLKASARKEDENELMPFLWIKNNKADKIKDFILLSLIPSIGFTYGKSIENLNNYSYNKLLQIVNNGIADNLTTEEILLNIVGTKANLFKDAGINPTLRGTNTLINDVFQNATSIISASVFSMYSKKYIWLSVMDSRTSDICISRNKQVYTYGKGPLPPAHTHCRSKTAPWNGQAYPEQSFALWAESQPARFKKYLQSNFAPFSFDELETTLESILNR